MHQFQRSVSLDLEDELGSTEIHGLNVFPVLRLEQLVRLLSLDVAPDISDLQSSEVVERLFPVFLAQWAKNERDSFLAFKGLSHILKGCLMLSSAEPHLFQKMVLLGGDQVVPFLAQAVPYMIDSEMVQGANAIDLLLSNLAVVAVETGRNYLREFIESVPFISGFYLGVHRKQFEELHKFIVSKRSVTFGEDGKVTVAAKPHYLHCLHFPTRKIIVSNAPPVKLHRSSVYRRQRKYSCEMSAGGLVSGIKPSLETSDIWVSYLDPSLIGLDRMPAELSGRIFKESVRIPPQYRRTSSLSASTLSEEEESNGLEDFLWEKAENDFLSLQDRLRAFAEQNFHVNPLVILKDDHRGFYNGISNGLFWPAFHNLPEYIIDQYKAGGTALAEDWQRYIKVNFHFGIHTARNCRNQDFIWIHDYHLMLVGQILRSLNPEISCGFFLHIPFAITEDLMEKYHNQAVAALRGLLGFKRVGFQTRHDCENYVRLVLKHIPGSSATEKLHWPRGQGYTVNWNGWVTDVGTFPISVKLDAVFKVTNHPQTPERVLKFREKMVHNTLQSSPADIRVFLSVERFDYTKGIKERLVAIDLYFEQNPEAIGKDIFYQIAATSRADVSSYKEYQDACMKLVEDLNKKYGKTATVGTEERHWVPVIMDTKNNPYDDVIALYKIADVVVVTPIIDGMNLVIKEAILSNPSSVFLFSQGAGAVKQFNDAGLSHNYLVIQDINNAQLFAKRLHQATLIQKGTASEHGQRLYEFVTQHDIGHWISTYTNPEWTQGVIQVPVAAERVLPCRILEQLVAVRRQMIDCLMSAYHIGEAEQMSLTNVSKAINVYSAGENVEVQVGDAVISIPHKQLLSGVALDVEFLKSFWMSDQLSTLQEVFIHSSQLSEDTFKSQLMSLQNFMKKMGSIDVLIISYEDLCVNPSAFDVDTRAPNYHLSLLQTFTSSVLLTRFAWRRGCQVVLLSNMARDHLEEAHCFYEGLPTVFRRGVENDPSVVRDKKVALCTPRLQCDDFVDWLSDHVSSLFLIPIGRLEEQKATKVISPSEYGVLTAPEVLYAACALEIQKDVHLNLGDA